MINLSTCIAYGVEKLNNKEVTLKFFCNIQTPIKPVEIPATLNCQFNEEGKVNIGRNSKKNELVIPLLTVSPSSHAVISKDGKIINNSKNGTYIFIRDYEDIVKG